MAETALPASAAGLGALSLAARGAHAGQHEGEQDVSVVGVMILSAVSVLMAIFAMVTLALVVIGAWWVVSHIPVPPLVMHLLTKLHLAGA